MTVVHPIARAWISTGGTGARNYDEFADDAEITAIIAANPASALAIEMPHRAPGERRPVVPRLACPTPCARLASAKDDGSYAAAEEVVALYRITGARRGRVRPVVAWSTPTRSRPAPTSPGLVIRNEDVFIEKVRERVALAEATGHLLSPVLLLQTGTRRRAARGAGRPRPRRPARRR